MTLSNTEEYYSSTYEELRSKMGKFINIIDNTNIATIFLMSYISKLVTSMQITVVDSTYTADLMSLYFFCAPSSVKSELDKLATTAKRINFLRQISNENLNKLFLKVSNSLLMFKTNNISNHRKLTAHNDISLCFIGTTYSVYQISLDEQLVPEINKILLGNYSKLSTSKMPLDNIAAIDTLIRNKSSAVEFAIHIIEQTLDVTILSDNEEVYPKPDFSSYSKEILFY